jgi:antitoxin component YwqK of YwqJK toxin-antitoxin module
MTQERYLLTDSELCIEDEELGIRIRLSSELPRLPDPLCEKEGICLEKDESGSICTAYAVFEGKKHGACRFFYPDGAIKAEMFYDHGALHGPSTFFSNKTERYRNNLKNREFDKEVSQNFHLEDATIVLHQGASEDENFEKKPTPSKTDSSGCFGILAQTWYVHGKKMGKAKFFYASGQLASIQRFKDGTSDGTQEYWYEDGTVKSLIPYIQGALHGEVRLFWESGQLKRSAHYCKGLREGGDRLWNEKGILIDEGEFHNGQPMGLHRQFFSDGQIKEELFYHTSFRFDRIEWNSAGVLLREGKYASDLSYTERTFLQPSGAEVRKGYWDGQRLCWK